MPGVFSEHLNITVTHLKRKGNPMLYAATKTLMERTDLFPCDKNGNIVGLSAPQAAGIHPVHPAAQANEAAEVASGLVLENIAKALGAPLDVVKAMAEGKARSEIEAEMESIEKTATSAGISPAVETADVPPVLDPDASKEPPAPPDDETLKSSEEDPEAFEYDPEGNWSTYNRENMCKWALEKYGDRAASIDPEWSRKDIMVAIETLEGSPAE